MTDDKRPKPPATLAARIGPKAERTLSARRRGQPGVWFGLGMMGLIGWSIAIPTLLGAAAGLWLDQQYPGSRSWTSRASTTIRSLAARSWWRTRASTT